MPKMIGGEGLALLFGALLGSWFINTFFIYPYIGYANYNLNLATFINLIVAFQLPGVTFILVAAAIWFGYFGVKMHHGKGAGVVLFLLPPSELLKLLMALPAILLITVAVYAILRTAVYLRRQVWLHVLATQ